MVLHLSKILQGMRVEARATKDEPASPVLPRRCDRLIQPPERYSPRLFFTDSSEPTNYDEATQSKDFLDWQLAMESEMNSIHANHTWNLVELPKNRKALCWGVGGGA